MEISILHGSIESNRKSFFLKLSIEVRLMIYGYLIPHPGPPKGCGPVHRDYASAKNFINFIDDPKDLNILAVNREIHLEASSMLYSKIPFLLTENDIFYLIDDDVLDRDAPRQPENSPWRHDPRDSVTEVDGIVTYSGPELAGSLEPHILARFKNVVVDAGIAFCGGRLELNLMRFNFNFELRAEDHMELEDAIGPTLLFGSLARVLSNSPILKSLKILVSVELDVDIPDTNSQGNLWLPGEEDWYIMTAQSRASKIGEDIVMQCGVMEPLKELANVQNVMILFSSMIYNVARRGLELGPSAASIDAMRDLERAMKRNYDGQLADTEVLQDLGEEEQMLL